MFINAKRNVVVLRQESSMFVSERSYATKTRRHKFALRDVRDASSLRVFVANTFPNASNPISIEASRDCKEAIR